MRSGWFFGSPMWQEYLAEYAKTRPECLNEWKSSPLANDHDFTEYVDEPASAWVKEERLSQVIDLRTHKWSDIRKSYRGLINRENYRHLYFEHGDGFHYRQIHIYAFGECRTGRTYDIQEQWIKDGYAMCLTALNQESGEHVAAALWIIYQGSAYYASGPSLQGNVQKAVIWESLKILQSRGIALVDMGQIDGEEAGTRGVFKTGFGGVAQPFTIVRRK